MCKKGKLTNEGENWEETNEKEENDPRITATLTVYRCFSLILVLINLNLSHTLVGAFSRNIYPYGIALINNIFSALVIRMT